LIAKQPESLPFLLDSPAEKYLFHTHRKSSQILSLWLKNQVCYQPLDQQLTRGWAVHYYPIARFWKGLLDLCLDIHNAAPNLMPSPAALWYGVLWNSINDSVQVSGLTGNPELFSKGQIVTKSRQVINRLKTRSLEFESNSTAYVSTLHIAQFLAESYPDFHEKALLPFCKEWTTYVRHIEKCKELQYIFLLPNGLFWITGNGKRLPSKSLTKLKSKGGKLIFVKKQA